VKIGLLGLPKSGKTTLFNALTKSQAQVSAFAGNKAEPNVSIVKVGDERITKLSEMYKPKKTIYATLEVVDFVAVEQGTAKEDNAAWNELLKVLRNADALALVIRNFENDVSGKADPIKIGRAHV
jgi:ribosome-binding ATPase YchF (GTP1/OBG family)